MLGSRYLLYGEWLYARHTIYYDALPHYFLEFDVLDRSTGEFLSTDRRRELLSGVPIVSAPVLWRGVAKPALHIQHLITPSNFRTAAWRARLQETCLELGVSFEAALEQIGCE